MTFEEIEQQEANLLRQSEKMYHEKLEDFNTNLCQFLYSDEMERLNLRQLLKICSLCAAHRPVEPYVVVNRLDRLHQLSEARGAK